MVFGYIRVSTEEQDLSNQKIGIEKKAKALGLKIDKYISDFGISGTKDPKERALGGFLKHLKKGDIIICSEISRLGRKLFMIMKILEYLMKKEVKLYTVKDNYELGNDIQSKVLAFAFGISAEIEHKLLSERVKEALEKAKKDGKILGRPRGSKNLKNKLGNKKEFILKLLERKETKKTIAKKCKVSRPTLYKFLNSLKEFEKKKG